MSLAANPFGSCSQVSREGTRSLGPVGVPATPGPGSPRVAGPVLQPQVIGGARVTVQGPGFSERGCIPSLQLPEPHMALGTSQLSELRDTRPCIPTHVSGQALPLLRDLHPDGEQTHQHLPSWGKAKGSCAPSTSPPSAGTVPYHMVAAAVTVQPWTQVQWLWGRTDRQEGCCEHFLRLFLMQKVIRGRPL